MKAKVSRGLRGLPNVGNDTQSLGKEADNLKSEAAEIEQWWSNSHRWGYTKRPFTGAYLFI